MPDISTPIITQKLNINLLIKPIAQRKGLWVRRKKIVIPDKVGMLVVIHFIKEIRFQTRVANPILVKKSNDRWRMCVE